MTASSPRPADRPRLPRLYPIVDVDLCRLRGREPRELARAYAAGGARLLQLRQKAPGSAGFLAICRAIVADRAASGVSVIVNDRADLAVMADAQGVHVGQEDLPPAAAREIVGPGRLVGVSTHTPAQIDDALAADIDYLAVGPVFRTSTKDTGYDPRGLDLVRYAAGRGRPVVAIGGISMANAVEVLDAGAAAVAVISDLLASPDPAARIAEYLSLLGDSG